MNGGGGPFPEGGERGVPGLLDVRFLAGLTHTGEAYEWTPSGDDAKAGAGAAARRSDADALLVVYSLLAAGGASLAVLGVAFLVVARNRRRDNYGEIPDDVKEDEDGDASSVPTAPNTPASTPERWREPTSPERGGSNRLEVLDEEGSVDSDADASALPQGVDRNLRWLFEPRGYGDDDDASAGARSVDATETGGIEIGRALEVRRVRSFQTPFEMKRLFAAEKTKLTVDGSAKETVVGPDGEILERDDSEDEDDEEGNDDEELSPTRAAGSPAGNYESQELPQALAPVT